MAPDRRDFFISYNKADKDWAKWVDGLLKKDGYTTYIQAEDIKPGKDFMMKCMNKFLENSNGFIPIMSQKYKDSEYCQLEFAAALDKHLIEEYRFFIVRVEDVNVHDLVRTIIRTDVFIKGESADYAQTKNAGNLLKRIKAMPAQNTNKSTAAKNPSSGASNPPPTAPYPGVSTGSDTPNHFLPPCPANFTGRVTLLKDIHDGLNKSKRVVLSGLGGFGKTTAALKYAHQNAAEYDYICFVNADSRMTLEQDYKNFAAKINLPVPEVGKFEQIQPVVKEWMETTPRWLFIFDNAEGLPGGLKGLKQYLPQNFPSQNSTGHVIITTRERCDADRNKLGVETFTKTEALEYLRNQLSGSNNKEDCDGADKLAEALGYLPLALTHAASYMLESKRGCAEYSEALKVNGLELLKEGAGEIDPQKTIKATWITSIKEIKSKHAEELFNLCAYFAPDDIPLSMFWKGREQLPQTLRDFFSKVTSL